MKERVACWPSRQLSQYLLSLNTPFTSGDLKMPSKKRINITSRFAQENLERPAIISVGDKAVVEPEKKDDTEKPLYLKRI
jgi:hypothetical protein